MIFTAPASSSAPQRAVSRPHSISCMSSTSTGEWMYRVGGLMVVLGMPPLVRWIAVASVVPPVPTSIWTVMLFCICCIFQPFHNTAVSNEPAAAGIDNGDDRAFSHLHRRIFHFNARMIAGNRYIRGNRNVRFDGVSTRPCPFQADFFLDGEDPVDGERAI